MFVVGGSKRGLMKNMREKKTSIFAGANFVVVSLSIHLVLSHISLPSRPLLEARDVTNMLLV